jgi:hypothetical protein
LIRLVLLLARGFRLATARVHAPAFWRALYRLIAAPGAVRAVASLARRDGGDVLLAQLGTLFVWSGWPHQSRGWTNLDASRFLRRVRREVRAPEQVVPKAPLRASDGPLRVGCLGAFSGLLTLAREHFENAPDDVELHVLDLGFEGRYARYLEPVAASYATDDLAEAAGDLDVLYVVGRGAKVDAVIDAARTPCVAAFCTGSDLLHHEKVDFHLYPQPEADYFLCGNSLFCGTSRVAFGDELVYPGFFLYDPGGLDAVPRAPWARREPLVLVHGSVFKAASEPFLDAVLPLLHDGVELVVMGRATEAELSIVRRASAAHGVAARVHYEGAFSGLRGPHGARDDPGWRKLVGLLGRARLAPDPWPIGGAASRVEAYAAGVPAPHLAVRFDEGAWGRRQDSLLEVEALLVPEATATTPAHYHRLCRRFLSDEDFADGVAAAQVEVADRVTDARAYWLQLVEAYRDWMRRVTRPRYAAAR